MGHVYVICLIGIAVCMLGGPQLAYLNNDNCDRLGRKALVPENHFWGKTSLNFSNPVTRCRVAQWGKSNR